MCRLPQIQRAQRCGRVAEHWDVIRTARPRLDPGILVREAQQLKGVVGGPFHILVRPSVF